MKNLGQMNDDLSTPFDEAIINGMERSIHGVDITSMIQNNANQQAQKQQADQNKMQEAMRFYEMAQRGDLVPKELINSQPTPQTQPAPIQQETVNLQQAIQNPTQNSQFAQPAQNAQQTSSNEFENWLNDFASGKPASNLGTSINNNNPQPQSQPAPQVAQETVQQAETNIQSDSKAVLDENLRRISMQAAKRGFTAEQREMAQNIALNLTENDILDLVQDRMRRKQMESRKPAPAMTVAGNSGYTARNVRQQEFRLAGIGANNVEI